MLTNKRTHNIRIYRSASQTNMENLPKMNKKKLKKHAKKWLKMHFEHNLFIYLSYPVISSSYPVITCHILSSCHPFILSSGHLVIIWSPGHLVIWSSCHIVILSYCHPISCHQVCIFDSTLILTN